MNARPETIDEIKLKGDEGVPKISSSTHPPGCPAGRPSPGSAAETADDPGEPATTTTMQKTSSGMKPVMANYVNR